jgi:hypothetical protein
MASGTKFEIETTKEERDNYEKVFQNGLDKIDKDFPMDLKNCEEKEIGGYDGYSAFNLTSYSKDLKNRMSSYFLKKITEQIPNFFLKDILTLYETGSVIQERGEKMGKKTGEQGTTKQFLFENKKGDIVTIESILNEYILNQDTTLKKLAQNNKEQTNEVLKSIMRIKISYINSKEKACFPIEDLKTENLFKQKQKDNQERDAHCCHLW